MENSCIFKNNLNALSLNNRELGARLADCKITFDRYKILRSASGLPVPAIISGDSSLSLHSTVDPEREAFRLVSGFQDGHTESFFVFLGLGGAYAPSAALNSKDTCGVLVIDYCLEGIAELFYSIDFTALLNDPRFTLLADPQPEQIEAALFELYLPSFCTNLQVLPLRSRVEKDKKNFNAAKDVLQGTLKKIKSDYSVQSYFGKRWFNNIIRNLDRAQTQICKIKPAHDAAICAAGPSLNAQIDLLAGKKKQMGDQLLVLSADTALPVLLSAGFTPDAVVSIDCQHYSYYHFIGSNCPDIPLFLDLASPPLLANFSNYPFFFSSAHPLAQYLSRNWLPLPVVDVTGGNVTYACLSLLEGLGAQRIQIYGADFSYPGGKIYAKGSCVYRLFEQKQNRFSPLESCQSRFLFRSPFLPSGTGGLHCYETELLRFYRKNLEQKASKMEAEIFSAPGTAIPLVIDRKYVDFNESIIDNGFFNQGIALMEKSEFLKNYLRNIEMLPNPKGGLNAGQRSVFTTLLPLAAAIKFRRPDLSAEGLFEEVKRYCSPYCLAAANHVY